MAEYNVQKTGDQVKQALTNALALASIVTVQSIGGQTYNVLWEIAPTDTNQVYGLAVHPTTGQLYRIYNDKGSYSATKLAAVGSTLTVGNADVAPAISAVTGFQGNKQAFEAAYDATTSILSLIPLSVTSSTICGAVASTTTITTVQT